MNKSILTPKIDRKVTIDRAKPHHVSRRKVATEVTGKSIGATPEKSPLHIEKLPEALQWWDEERFWLVHTESGLRVPGSWSAAEAQEILDLSKNWNWSLDGNRRVPCALQLMALAESICKRSSQKGGET